MTEPDRAHPGTFGGEPRGVGESRDAPAADIPRVDDRPVEQPMQRSDSDLVMHPTSAPGSPTSAPGHPRKAVIAVVPGEQVPDAPQQASVRRAPRYRAFIATGAIVGAVLAVVLTGAFPVTGGFSTSAVLGYLGVTLALIGALVGGGVAVLVERSQRDR